MLFSKVFNLYYNYNTPAVSYCLRKKKTKSYKRLGQKRVKEPLFYARPGDGNAGSPVHWAGLAQSGKGRFRVWPAVVDFFENQQKL